VRLPVLLATALALGACGTKGPLYLVGEGGQRIVRENQPGLRAPVLAPGVPAAARPAASPPAAATTNGKSAASTSGSEEEPSPAVDVGPTVPMTLPAQ
jgi:hypothetical protein